MSDPLRPAGTSPTDRRFTRRKRTDSDDVVPFLRRMDETREAEPAADTSPSETLQPPHSEDVAADVEELMDEVHQAGEKLLQSRTYTAAREYRNAIQRFLRRVVPGAVEVNTVQSNRDILRPKRYTLLSRIDQSVDRLIAGILQAQTEQIEIVRRLEEIRGMLVDLVQ